MSTVNTIGASSTLTERKLEASIATQKADQTNVSPQTSVEAQKKPLDENYLVLLNLKNFDQKIDKNNDLIIDKNLKLNLDNKNIILKDTNCYLIKK